MKILKYILASVMITLLAVSCDKELDPIIPSNPKPDVDGPQIVINYPIEGKPFVSPDEIATITFQVVASDDIELQSVILELDGVQIANLSGFLDYRRAVIKYNYNLGDGPHTLRATATDLTGKSDTESVSFNKVTAPVYEPLEGEVLYLPLDGYFLDLISGNEMTIIGTPGFATGKVNDAYAGAADSYLSYPAAGLLGEEFSVSFWYKVNPEPLRGGMLAISAEGESRNTGLRMFHENSGANQNVGLNFGIGETEIWMNPIVSLPPEADWVHIAISISTTMATIYVNGEIPLTNGELELEAGIDWTGCNSISIASGEPNFTYWEHFYDSSLYDEVHMFNRAITAEEVMTFYNGK